MKLPKMTGSCNTEQRPAGTPASIYLTCTCEVGQDRVRTYSELRTLATLPVGVTLPTTENKLAERVQVGEALTFTGTGNGFTRYDIVINTGKYGSKTVGEPMFLSFNNETGFAYQGTEAEVLGFADFIQNRPLIVLIGDMGITGAMNLMGQKDFPVYPSEITIDSGAKAGDKRICTFKLVDHSGRMIYKYDVATLHPTGLPLAT